MAATGVNGNNVNLDEETLALIEPDLRYQVTSQAIPSKFALLRTATGRGYGWPPPPSCRRRRTAPPGSARCWTTSATPPPTSTPPDHPTHHPSTPPHTDPQP